MIKYLVSRGAIAAALAAASLSFSAIAQTAPNDLEDSIRRLQHEWAVIQYKTPVNQRVERFAALSNEAHRLSTRYAARAEPHTWEGIILSSWAGAKGGLGALSLAKRAKTEYETAIRIDSKALDGSAVNSLGVLYYKVPGWPVGFGDNKKAEALLLQALALNPDGMDPNFFYGDFLAYRNRKNEAVRYLEKALKAPPRPGREVADEGRKDEARELLQKIRAEISATPA